MDTEVQVTKAAGDTGVAYVRVCVASAGLYLAPDI